MTAKRITVWACEECNEWYHEQEDAEDCCNFEPPIPNCSCGCPAFRHRAVLAGSGQEATCMRCPCRKYEPAT